MRESLLETSYEEILHGESGAKIVKILPTFAPGKRPYAENPSGYVIIIQIVRVHEYFTPRRGDFPAGGVEVNVKESVSFFLFFLHFLLFISYNNFHCTGKIIDK